MNKWKKLSIVGITLMSVILLTACGNSNASKSASSSLDQSSQTQDSSNQNTQTQNAEFQGTYDNNTGTFTLDDEMGTVVKLDKHINSGSGDTAITLTNSRGITHFTFQHGVNGGWVIGDDQSGQQLFSFTNGTTYYKEQILKTSVIDGVQTTDTPNGGIIAESFPNVTFNNISKSDTPYMAVMATVDCDIYSNQ